MIDGLHQAQAQFDAQEHPACFLPDECSDAEALRDLLERAAKAAELYVDSCETSVEEHEGGECAVELSLWPCRFKNRRQLADALVAMAAFVVAAERKGTQ